MELSKEALQLDQEHQFAGITVKIISVSDIKSQIDGKQVYVKVCCHEKSGQTKRKINDQQTIVFDQEFFYNTAQQIDDDIVFELYQTDQNLGASKGLLNSSKSARSKSIQIQGKILGSTKPVQISRQKRQQQQKTYDMISINNKIVAKIKVSYDFLQRQNIVGGIKCPDLSLKSGFNLRKSGLALENKYAAYKNLFSLLDGNQTPNCEIFAKKFHK